MNPETAIYKIMVHMSETTSDANMDYMLQQINRLLPLLERTQSYAKIAHDVATGNIPPLDRLNTTVDELKTRYPDIDANAMLWIIGLRYARAFEDFEILCIQLSLFVASQKANLYRIENDKLRLIVTYMHVSLMKGISE